MILSITIYFVLPIQFVLTLAFEKQPSSLGKGVLKIFSKFTRKHLWRRAISVKFQIEITFRHECSPVNLLHISRTPFPKNTPEWLLLAFDSAVLHENNALSYRVLRTKKWYTSFLRKVLVFQKTCFKVKVLKTFKIPTDYHIKTCQSLKWRAKIASTDF